ncbi:MAG: molecular chaperone TorD family protein [Candidatus Thiodiazotropha sp.]
MTQNSQAAQPSADENVTTLRAVAGDAIADALPEEQSYRSSAYALLSRLLRTPPDQSVLDQVSGFAEVDAQQDEMTLAMSMLGLAAGTSRPEAVDDEFHALFIGIGRGELVPYASWYLTGFLMERPLGRLRDDLAALGFHRQEGVCEPEDHAAALCEVMAMLIQDGARLDEQMGFFRNHISDWLGRFFEDLGEAKSAVFYRAVGRFGAAFCALEKRYLNMPV